MMMQGLVTATTKLNRRAIREHYAKEIKDCFASLK
jgi:hypothetical protein